jgi:hypothetical protein
MNVLLRAILVVAIGLCVRPAAAVPVVLRPAAAPSTSDYEAAASTAGVKWDGNAGSEPTRQVLVRVEEKRITLSVDLPPRLPLAAAQAWTQGLADQLKWGEVRLYSYQNALQLRVTAWEEKRPFAVGPFQRRAVLDLAPLEARLRQFAPGRMLVCLRIRSGTVLSAEPAPTARATRGSDTYLFYSGQTTLPRTIVVTYGLTAKQGIGLLVALALWVLFPIAVLWIVRSHFVTQSTLPAEEAPWLYARWQRGVRIAGLAGTLLTFLVLYYSRVVPAFFSPGFSLLVPLWWWYRAVEKLIVLPNGSDELGQAGVPDRWLSAAGDFVVAGLMALFILTPYYASRETLTRATDLIPLLVGGGGALLLLGSTLLGYLALRMSGTSTEPAPSAGEMPDDPAVVRELLQKLAAEIAAEEAVPLPDLSTTNPSLAVRYALSAFAVTQALDVEQRAALRACDQLARRGKPVRTRSLHSLVWSFCPLVVAGGVAYFVPGMLRFAVLLTGAGMTGVFTTTSRSGLSRALKSLPEEMEDADFRVASAMEEPSRLLDALSRLEECDRLHLPSAMAGSSEPSINGERRLRLRRRLEESTMQVVSAGAEPS